MVNETPRLGLNTYEQGDENWSHTDAVEAVDEHAIKRGSISDRPSKGEYDDELFAAVDQRIIWRWDEGESDWKAFSGLGSDGNPVPGTSYFEALEAGSISTDEAEIKERNLTLGEDASSTDDDVTVLGGGASYDPVDDDSHNQNEAVVIGTDASADTGWSVTIGAGAQSSYDETYSGDSTIAIGRNATAQGHSQTVIGRSASATGGYRSVVIGRGAVADDALHPISIGYKAHNTSGGGIAIGKEAETAEGNFATAIGSESSAETEGVAVGYVAEAGDGATAVGRQSVARGSGRDEAIAIGNNAQATGRMSIAIGRSAEVTEDDTMVVALDFDNVLKLDDDGNLEITGEITENATL